MSDWYSGQNAYDARHHRCPPKGKTWCDACARWIVTAEFRLHRVRCQLHCPRCGESWGVEDWRYVDDIHSVPSYFGDEAANALAEGFTVRRSTAQTAVSTEFLQDLPFCLHRLSPHSRTNWQAEAAWLREQSTVRARLGRWWHGIRCRLAERIAPPGWLGERD